MTNIINKLRSSRLVSPLFDAGPILQPFELETILSDVEQLKTLIIERVGKVQQYLLYPHRIFKQRAWHIKIVGEKATTYLLFNIGGYYQFVNDIKASRLSLNVADDTDAFWLAYLLAHHLSIIPTVPNDIFSGGVQ